MEGINIELLVARVKEKYPEASARVFHPQSNGKLERFHSTLKTEHVRKTPYFSYEDAKEKMARWIDFYNNGRLHGALLYLTPEDYFAGRYKQKSLLAATAALLIHLISFPKKVQVHFGQDTMNPQKFGVKGVCRCAAGDMELFSVVTEHRDLSTCQGKYFPVQKTEMFFLVNQQVYCLFFYSFYCTEPKRFKK